MVGTGVVAMAFWTYHVMISTRHVIVSAPPLNQEAASVSAAHPTKAAPRQRNTSPLPPPEPVFALNGVVGGVGEPFAIINGIIVHLGETIEDATLVSVDAGTAKLRRKEKILVLQTAK